MKQKFHMTYQQIPKIVIAEGIEILENESLYFLSLNLLLNIV